MLRHFFPVSNRGAALYGGYFMYDNQFFYRIFEEKDTLKETLIDINSFLDENCYEMASEKEFAEDVTYRKHPVIISPEPYTGKILLTIQRDVFAKSETEFLITELKKFRDKRDWEQFHNPKDLSLALSIEANELLEQFLWKSADEANQEKVKEELADVFSFALLLADRYGFNIEDIVLDKIKQNEEKYPVDKAKGTAKKYNEL
jgi:NTP pyrophosphatase (non-canonical NTP hydrolase)